MSGGNTGGMVEQNPTQEQVRALFDYCPERGILTNKYTRNRLSRRGDQ